MYFLPYFLLRCVTLNKFRAKNKVEGNLIQATEFSSGWKPLVT